MLSVESNKMAVSCAVNLAKLEILLLTVSLMHLKSVFTLPEDPYLTFDKLYTSGISAYTAGKYHRCILYFEKALEDYKFYKQTIVECRIQCKEHSDTEDSAERKKGDGSSDNVDLDLFTRLVVESNCIRKCYGSLLGERPEERVSESVLRDFENRKPYHYLQFCYYKMKRYTDATSASYTFFLKNPDHTDTINNIREYRRRFDVSDEDIQDFERKPYKVLRLRGEKAYNEEDWEGVIENFEEGLKEYYLEDQICRMDCEGHFDHEGMSSGFINAVADHFISVLKCQLQCEDDLRQLFVEKIDDFLPEFYNYLQFAYFQKEEYEKSVETIESYLSLKDDDEEMNTNKAYFMQKLGFHEAYFVPRQEAVEYAKRREKMEKILKYVERKYNTKWNSISDIGDEDYFDEQRREKRKNELWEKLREEIEETDDEEERNEHYMKMFEMLGIKLLSDEKELKGPRFLSEGFFREDQCQELVFLANVVDPDENGLRVLTIPKALEISKRDAEYEISLRLFLKACETLRFYTARYFNATQLFVKDAQIVCREPVNDDVEKCTLTDSDMCFKDLQSETTVGGGEGEFVGIGYLTSNEDSEMYFIDSGQNPTKASVDVKCGRMTGFKASDEYKISSSGSQRCSLVLTYTKNRTDDYTIVRETITLLHKMDEARQENKENVDNSEIMKDLEKKGMTVVQSGSDLKGKERFMADGLAEEEECTTLVDLAKAAAIKGDGYNKATPHTKHEIFSGMDLYRASESGAVIGDGYKDKRQSEDINISPHTDFETFEGLTVQRALKLALSHTISRSIVELYLDVSEKGRFMVEKYFNLTRPLYFDFTHLVCRTAVEGDEEDRDEDLSHPVHADNCQLKPDGSCPRKFPSFVQRDYSAIIYLNDNFEGGDFFFAYSNKTEQVAVKPKCGRMVGFNAGEFHGVKAVLKGQRCALAMWYTLDPNYKEIARFHAKKLLSQMSDEKDNQLRQLQQDGNHDEL